MGAGFVADAVGRAFSSGHDLVDAGKRQAKGENDNALDDFFLLHLHKNFTSFQSCLCRL